jgi:N-methylhydantoinase A
MIGELEERGRSILMEGGVAKKDIATEISADMRYAGQGFEITVPITKRVLSSKDDNLLRETFVAQYEERFSRSLGQLPVECVSWRVRVIAPPSVADVRLERSKTKPENARIETRPAYFEEIGTFVSTPVFARATLKIGAKIEGPALIEEAESTCVVGPSASVSVDKHGNLLMKIRYPD